MVELAQKLMRQTYDEDQAENTDRPFKMGLKQNTHTHLVELPHALGFVLELKHVEEDALFGYGLC